MRGQSNLGLAKAITTLSQLRSGTRQEFRFTARFESLGDFGYLIGY